MVFDDPSRGGAEEKAIFRHSNPYMSRTLLVIPNFRDSARLAPFLGDLIATLPGHFSILISDDGSGGEEANRINGLLEQARKSVTAHGPEVLDPLLHHPNSGKGGAVIRGWRLAEGYSLLAFADADGAVSAAELLRAEQFMRSGVSAVDALFGSRVKMLGRRIHRTLTRHLLGRVFATLVSTVADIPAYDTQCGLKILKADAFEKIIPHAECAGFAFDVELLLLLRKKGLTIVEFPVDWRDVSGSKVSLLRDSLWMALEVFRIRRRVGRLDLKSKVKNPE